VISTSSASPTACSAFVPAGTDARDAHLQQTRHGLDPDVATAQAQPQTALAIQQTRLAPASR
jgi:hypothetical protein